MSIQARVFVPLIKAMQAELGEERSNAIVRKTLGDIYRKLGEQWWQAQELPFEAAGPFEVTLHQS